jgi:hypothetical protein
MFMSLIRRSILLIAGSYIGGFLLSRIISIFLLYCVENQFGTVIQTQFVANIVNMHPDG